MKTLFRFPNPVNEVSARLVAGGVVLLTLVILGFHQTWLIAPLAYGFAARVATGPTLSPLGQFVTRVLTPALPVAPRLVPGPPKRFAQGIGATLSVTAAVAHFAFGATTFALVLVAMITVAATLESVFGFCLGCKAFGLLMKAGVIPPEICAECADLTLRHPVNA
ncbi:MAG: glutaredoxin/malate transporter fusion protein [Acidimicrobiales bacterium]|nr:glutaredoxin/malate transporter fusion protein [Acidimicrobiales bacterium]